ncbi:MAG: hypothetical protein PHQ23_15400, partial [Candidatus Wallbacteria bacterium]|nr:hypothetical protein [Candidatus Wallbacteria bacterium]
AESMKRFGSDKPDLRYGLEITDLNEAMQGSEFKAFASVLEKGGRIGGLALKPVEQYSRKTVGEMEDLLKKEYKIGGLACMKIEGGKLDGGISKFLSPEIQQKVITACGIDTGVLFVVADADYERASNALGSLRRTLAVKEALIKNPDDLKFVWIHNFPLFERDEENNRIAPKHHIFTHPRDEHMNILESDPLKVHGKLYDLVLNGVELGSGSIRINSYDLQKRV